MTRHSLLRGALSLLLPVLFVGLLPPAVGAQPPAKKQVKKERVVPKKARAAPGEKSRAAPAVERHRPRRERPRRSYVPTRRDYGHVQVTRRHRRDDGRLDIRPVIVRSARVAPIVLDRFEDRRRDHHESQ